MSRKRESKTVNIWGDARELLEHTKGRMQFLKQEMNKLNIEYSKLQHIYGGLQAALRKEVK